LRVSETSTRKAHAAICTGRYRGARGLPAQLALFFEQLVRPTLEGELRATITTEAPATVFDVARGPPKHTHRIWYCARCHFQCACAAVSHGIVLPWRRESRHAPSRNTLGPRHDDAEMTPRGRKCDGENFFFGRGVCRPVRFAGINTTARIVVAVMGTGRDQGASDFLSKIAHFFIFLPTGPSRAVRQRQYHMRLNMLHCLA
jgi:hypothetical protein